jgi:hypothetical protein
MDSGIIWKKAPPRRERADKARRGRRSFCRAFSLIDSVITPARARMHIRILLPIIQSRGLVSAGMVIFLEVILYIYDYLLFD